VLSHTPRKKKILEIAVSLNTPHFTIFSAEIASVKIKESKLCDIAQMNFLTTSNYGEVLFECLIYLSNKSVHSALASSCWHFYILRLTSFK